MEFSIATLLSQFSEDKLVARKVLEKKLDCQDQESTEKLDIALDALERIGILAKDRGKYRRLEEDDVVEAKLRCSSKGFCFAIQDQETSEDVYIRESHLSNAWNSDRVLVKIIKEGSRRRSPEGEVKLILDRSNPSLLATVKKTDKGYRAVPLDDRLLFELNLKGEEDFLEKAVEHLVHVEVARYPLGAKLPIGRVTKVLGSDAEEAADTDIVCCKHDLPQTFSEEVLEAAEKLPKQLRQQHRKGREDLRRLLTLSIEAEGDSSTSRQKKPLVENTFTLEKTEAGNWYLGIHITDIAYFIEEGSPLDLEAKKRGTDIYLADLVLPLFPETVIRRCSLSPGSERLATSIFLTIDETGKVVEFELQPTVVKVDYQLSYQEVQSLLGGQEEVDEEMKPVEDLLKQLFFSLSPVVKARRQQRGAFELEAQDNALPYKDESRIGAVAVSSSLPIRSLLTELVVLANRAMAEHLQALDLPAIYCHQAEPDLEQLEDLVKLGSNLGLDLYVEDEEEIHPQDYQRFTQQFATSSARKILNYLLQSTLKSLAYSTKPAFHFGLAYEDGYTRCISPGRRYADLLMQRLLNSLFTEGRDRRSTRSKEGVNLGSSTSHGQINWNVLPAQTQATWEENLASVVPYLNEREKLAQEAEKDLEGLKKAEQMKERTGQVFQGLITGVQSYGFFVEIEDLLVEGLVHVSSLKDDWYEYRSRHSCLVGRKNRTAYRLGDRVEVQVKSVDYYRQQIDLVTVSGGSEASNEDLED